jgi:fructoselysine-6-P-deglycase FrlB-like protein
MTDTKTTLQAVIDQTVSADLSPIKNFLFSNPSEPLIATGSGGAETAGDFAALLYGARGGVATSVSPYTLNSFGDSALKTAKLLLISKGGHNNDIVFATKRALAVNPGNTAAINFSDSDRNEARKLFLKAGSEKSFVVPMKNVHDGFVSTGTSLSYFAIFTKIFQPEVDLEKYKTLPETPFTLCLNDGSALTPADFMPVRSYIILHGSWGRPVANNLEGKLVECGLASAGVYDYRNYCHGRFIFTSNHMEDSAVILVISPREKDIAERTRKFLPPTAKLIIIETEHDAPEASLDLLIRSTELFHTLCTAAGVNPESPKNPGKIDKRKPMWVPFTAELKKKGPLCLKDN